MATLQLRSTKRQKFVLAAIVCGMALAAAATWPVFGWSLVGLLALTYFLTVWVLDFDLRFEEWIVLPLYAELLALAAFLINLWYIHLTAIHWASYIGFSLVAYGLLLTLNILNVATVRALPLARQAVSVMSLFGAALFFTLTYLVLAWLPSLTEWIIAVAVIAWAISWPLIWSAKVGQSSNRLYDLYWSLLASLIGAQLAAVIGLWPISFMTSLILAGGLSMVIGLIHHHQGRQLTAALQGQYLLISGVMAMVFYLISRWS